MTLAFPFHSLRDLSSDQLVNIIKDLISLYANDNTSKLPLGLGTELAEKSMTLINSKIKMYNDVKAYERTRKYYHRHNSINNINIGDSDRLQVLLIGNVIDAVSSFAVSQPKHICILDEVVTSSRAYKEERHWDGMISWRMGDQICGMK